VDVFASNCATNSFPERNSDYCGGCGFVDVDFTGFGEDVFTAEHTSQYLSCYDGLVNVEGQGVKAQVLAWNEQDVIAIEVSDRRKQPTAVSTNLRMLRPAVVRTRSHTATSRLDNRDGRIVLAQRFTEDNYYCGSAVAVGIIGRNTKVKQPHDGELQLVAEPGEGSFTILIASAASFNSKEDVVASALSRLESAAARGYAGLVESNSGWWHDFWSKAFIHLHSADGVADYIEENYTYYLYIMASSSRGKYPAKFNGMLWITDGDTRQWGGQFWGANQSCLYNALLPTNRLELLDPMFDMYTGMFGSCSLAAQQQWGSQGVYLPETFAFDGLAKLPDDIAAEMQELYLLKKPWEQMSARFREFASTKQPYSSRWNWMGGGSWVDGRWRPTERGSGPYGAVTHIFSRGAKIAYQFWMRYEYSMDKQWLRDRAYPMLKGVAEFYRNYPNVKKDRDGKYHIYYVNSNESIWGGRDTDEEISSIMGILPVVIKASEILDVDAQMRPMWREFLDNLAPLPRMMGGKARIQTGGLSPCCLVPVPFGSSLRGSGRPDGNTMPIWFFDLCTLENDDPETMKIANATLDGYFRGGVGPNTRIGVLSKVGVTGAMMGRAEAVRYLLPNQLSFPDRSPILANRMDQREGRQTTSAQRLGRAADTLHNALCQSVPAGPGKTPVIHVFPAWPMEWDAEYTLLCRGGFLVTSAINKGQVEFIEIRSQLGGECRLRNIWGQGDVTLYRAGRKSESLKGSLLNFNTIKGEDIVVVRADTTPEQYRRAVLQGSE
jgi:hypothetical protein